MFVILSHLSPTSASTPSLRSRPTRTPRGPRVWLPLALAVLTAACGGGRSRGGDPGDGGRRDGAPMPCVSAFECWDPDPCMVASCDGSSCRSTQRLCPGGTTCDSTVGACTSRQACASSYDCADDDPCTSDERCDPATRTCAYVLLDGDGDGDSPTICGGRDCDDSNPYRGSLALESCNLEDDDCDGSVDEGTALALCGAASAACTGGSCTCPGAQELCEDYDTRTVTCVDVSSDARNCGYCRNACPAGDSCASGSCVCPGGGVDCSGSGSCTNLASDTYNCGRCGAYCPGECRGGVCDRCGDRGEACCSAGAAGGRCFTGVCGPASTCVACGGSGQPCCDAGAACASAAHVCRLDGTCGTCGAVGEPCCDGYTCDSTSVECLAGTCEARRCATAAPLPAAVLPRCSSTSYSCILACTTGACIDACYLADTTPSATYAGVPINCDQCDRVQTNACLSDACPAAWAAFACCWEDRCGSVDGTTCRTLTAYCKATYDALVVCEATPAAALCRNVTTGIRRLCFP